MSHFDVCEPVASFLVVTTANIGGTVTTEAALGFLGVGVPLPTPTWGNGLGGIMADVFRPRWWLVAFPGLALTPTVVTAKLFGMRSATTPTPRSAGRW